MKLQPYFVILAVTCLFVAACRGGGSTHLNDFLEMLPRDTEEMLYVNMARLLEDDDLIEPQGIAKEWDTSFYAVAQVNGNDIMALGEQDDEERDTLKDDLTDAAYDEVSGVEVWVDTSESWPAWEALAFLPNGLVLYAEEESLMENMLRRRERGGSSFQDKVGGMVSSLSPGIMLWILQNCEGSDCVIEGRSVEKESSQDFKASLVWEFKDDYGAKELFDDLKDELENEPEDDYLTIDCDESRIDRSGVRVTLEATCDIDEIDMAMGGELFWGLLELGALSRKQSWE